MEENKLKTMPWERSVHGIRKLTDEEKKRIIEIENELKKITDATEIKKLRKEYGKLLFEKDTYA